MCRWSLIAGRLPGRTANDVKNYWNTHIRKKESSHIKELKEKAQDMVKVKVIKPQPRTFSKKFTWFGGKPSVVESFQPKDDVRDIPQTFMQSENRINWWEILSNGEEGDERVTCGRLDEFPNKNLWAEELAPEAKVGDILDEAYALNCWDDFSIDNMDLWEVLNAE